MAHRPTYAVRRRSLKGAGVTARRWAAAAAGVGWFTLRLIGALTIIYSLAVGLALLFIALTGGA